MKISSNIFRSALVAGALACQAGGTQAALNLTGETYGTYGDANSYSLAVSAFIYNELNGGGVGPGNPFFVPSTPGAIKDFVVVATGASGSDVTTNYAGMDDAMATPSGVSGSNFFSGVWHSTVEALLTYLNGATPLFLFNNNQENSENDQNLAAWAQITLTGPGKDTLYFDLTNQLSPFKLITEGGGGEINGDPTEYTSTGAGPVVGTNEVTDYVFSGGPVCLDENFTPMSCDDPDAYTYGPINNNLGANQAVYALDVPELNWLITSGEIAGYTQFAMDLRLGCAPEGSDPESADCITRNLNNGYEQMFIVPYRVPEPGTLTLLLAGLGGALWRRGRRRAGDLR